MSVGVTSMMGMVKRSRSELAELVAQDIPEGWYVNLGIGLPTMVANVIPAERGVVLQSENGLLGMGPAPGLDDVDEWLINAGKEPVTLLPGAALFHHADSFAMIRGGHLDLCILGAYEVSSSGDLANWRTLDETIAPAVGGAMDLAAGARSVWVMTEHVSKRGEPKLVELCSYPITAAGVVDRIYTDLATIEVTASGFLVSSMVTGMTRESLQALTGALLHFPGAS